MPSAAPVAFRLLEDGAADGFRNMAQDEALLESCAAGAPGFPVLRLYAFRPPCLSLGFSQEHAAAVDLAWCREHGIDVVRRPTGGRAVLHDDEVTYAVVARRDAPPFEGGLLDAYHAAARGLIDGFRRLGIEAQLAVGARSGGSPRAGAVCFAGPSRHEIVARGMKIAGSSQARRRGALLQHGSIPLRLDGGRLGAAAGDRGSALPASSGLSALLGREIPAPEVREALRIGFASALGAAVVPGSWTAEEAERAERLRAHRYLTEAWTLRR